MELKKLVRAVNVPHHVCTHMFGKDHSHAHRMSVGALVMVCGVTFVKLVHVANFPVMILVDIVGYAVHGVGLTPFIEAALEVAEEER